MAIVNVFADEIEESAHLISSDKQTSKIVLFGITENNPTRKEQARQFEAFETMKGEKIGGGGHETFHRMVNEPSRMYW